MSFRKVSRRFPLIECYADERRFSYKKKEKVSVNLRCIISAKFHLTRHLPFAKVNLIATDYTPACRSDLAQAGIFADHFISGNLSNLWQIKDSKFSLTQVRNLVLAP